MCKTLYRLTKQHRYLLILVLFFLVYDICSAQNKLVNTSDSFYRKFADTSRNDYLPGKPYYVSIVLEQLPSTIKVVRQINQHKRQALRKEVGMSSQDAERLQQDVVPEEFARQEVAGGDLQVRLERSIARLFIEHGHKVYGDTIVAQYLHNELVNIEWVDTASEFIYRDQSSRKRNHLS